MYVTVRGRFLAATLAHYDSLGVTVGRVMTDNGACYKSFAFRDLCRARGLKHIRTKAYTPKTNGKAERFIQTLARMGLCPSLSHLSPQSRRFARLAPSYNWHRPHGGINSNSVLIRTTC